MLSCVCVCVVSERSQRGYATHGRTMGSKSLAASLETRSFSCSRDRMRAWSLARFQVLSRCSAACSATLPLPTSSSLICLSTGVPNENTLCVLCVLCVLICITCGDVMATQGHHCALWQH